MSEPPVPQRLGRPRWMDLRIVGGVLLLVASVVIGAKVIGASSQLSPVWSASHDLAAGTVLEASDVVAVDVNLGDHGGAYLDASSPLEGKVLNGPLHAGELIPVRTIGAVTEGRIVTLAVAPEHFAPGIVHGSVVDLYLVSTDRDARSSADDGEATRLQLADVTVQQVTAPSSGGLSGAVHAEYQVSLLLATDKADALVKELQGHSPLLVLHATGKG